MKFCYRPISQFPKIQITNTTYQKLAAAGSSECIKICTVLRTDSNTANIKFGKGIGNLGAWMPGKRVKVVHIDAIPKPDKIGPYRNIVIHTGINSINCSPRYRKSNRALIDGLETKVRSICEMYPKSKVYISLLLQTRLAPLNQ